MRITAAAGSGGGCHTKEMCHVDVGDHATVGATDESR
jgi:hypothetical protein